MHRVNNDFRHLLYPLDHPRLAGPRKQPVREFSQKVKAIPVVQGLSRHWETLAAEPFQGLTCDGVCEPNLFDLAEEDAPVEAMAAAAHALIALLDGSALARLRHPIDSDAWRRWSNPEFLWNDNGLRLDECPLSVRAAVTEVLRNSLSAKGFAKARGCMHTNAFLGELTQLPHLMNEYSYNFVLFGDPSSIAPWGWSLYGHHLALNCLTIGRQMVVSPIFMGAEPNRIDTGPHAGLRMFADEEEMGLGLMRSLVPELREQAQLWPVMQGPPLPEGRWHPADGLHLGGAFQDNRVVPFEGVRADRFDRRQRDGLVELLATFVEYLPGGPLAARMRQIERHLDRTYWCWIGGDGDEDPFYYRIQSPVIMAEFDHHIGVWLNNTTPAKCHIHTVVRTPNGNDYGKDLLRQHLIEAHTGGVRPDAVQ